MTAKHTHTARMLLSRLERLSADSHYAHRASGLRGSLLRYLEQEETSGPPEPSDTTPSTRLDDLFNNGFDILESAARQIRPPRR